MISNEYPIGISQDTHRSFTLFVNEIDLIEDIKNASPDAVEKMADKDREARQTTVWACALSLPNTMNDSQSHGWDNSESFISTAVKAAGSGIASAALVGATGGLGKLGKLGKAAGAGLQKSGGFNAASVVKEVSHKIGNRQPIVNPMYWQEYRGSDPRTFNFTWDLIPNSKQESEQILQILKKLKQYSSPKLTALELGLLSPYTFDVTIANGHIDDIMKLKNLAIRNVSINYVADGAVQFHHDGAPKHISLSIQFVELRTITADDYDGSGVGGLHGGMWDSLAVKAVGSIKGLFDR